MITSHGSGAICLPRSADFPVILSSSGIAMTVRSRTSDRIPGGWTRWPRHRRLGLRRSRRAVVRVPASGGCSVAMPGLPVSWDEGLRSKTPPAAQAGHVRLTGRGRLRYYVCKRALHTVNCLCPYCARCAWAAGPRRVGGGSALSRQGEGRGGGGTYFLTASMVSPNSAHFSPSDLASCSCSMGAKSVGLVLTLMPGSRSGSSTSSVGGLLHEVLAREIIARLLQHLGRSASSR